MNRQTLQTFLLTAGLMPAMFGQNAQHQASIIGGGSDRAKCTVEILVDDVVQVEIRGVHGTIRTLSGQPGEWRRFDCTAELPPSPSNVKFWGVDGRGRQELVRDPHNGGVAVVQIEDRDGGAGGYTFEITWDAHGSIPAVNPRNDQNRDRAIPEGDRGSVNPPPDRNRGQDQNRPNYRETDYYRRYHHAFGVDEAVRLCQQTILTQARHRFHTNDIHLHRTAIDDGPGRNDWVTGTLDVHRDGREERFGFSCSVDFDNGRIRSAQLDPKSLPDEARWH